MTTRSEPGEGEQAKCEECGGLNGLHVYGCTQSTYDADHTKPETVKADAAGSEEVQLALAVERISAALGATPMNVALAALAMVVGRAQYGLQKDPLVRHRNMVTFQNSVTKAINMFASAEALESAQREAAQKSDPVRKLN